MPVQSREDEDTVMRCGLGYVTYRGTVRFSPHVCFAYSLSVSAITDTTVVVAELHVDLATGSEPADVGVEAIADFATGSAGGPCAVFARGGMGMFSHPHPLIGDCFLAASEPWVAEGAPHRVRARHDACIRPDAPLVSRFVFGHRRDCTLEWLADTAAKAVPSDAADEWRTRAAEGEARPPELWMQHEDTWGRCNALSLLGSAIPLLSGPDDPGPEVLPTRKALALAMALASFAPPTALPLLLDAGRRQSRAGRIAEHPGRSPGEDIDPANDRSDLEILFLVAWMEYLSATKDCECLDAVCEWASDGCGTVWEHLVSACTFIRDELRTGPNGHVRMLAGDWCGYLDSAGIHGRGESVLNSAMLCYALRPLHALARERGNARFADVLTAWHRDLSLAVGAAFDREWFVRGFTDQGSSFGSPHQGRCFLDVQSWAVLAKCGSAAHREAALRNALDHNCGDGDPRCLSIPYTVPPPAAVSTSLALPGEDWNAGVRMPEAAWFIWALASERMDEAAMREWEKITVRARLAKLAGGGFAALHATESQCGVHAGHRQGAASLTMLPRPLQPVPDACVWQPFALRKILGPQPPPKPINCDGGS